MATTPDSQGLSMFYAVIGKTPVKLLATNLEDAMKEVKNMDDKSINPDQPIRIMHVIGDVQPQPKPDKKRDAEYWRAMYDLGGES